MQFQNVKLHCILNKKIILFFYSPCSLTLVNIQHLLFLSTNYFLWSSYHAVPHSAHKINLVSYSLCYLAFLIFQYLLFLSTTYFLLSTYQAVIHNSKFHSVLNKINFDSYSLCSSSFLDIYHFVSFPQPIF